MDSNSTCDHLHWNAIFLLQTLISYPLTGVAICSQIICISLIRKMGIFHPNVKSLLIGCSIAALLACTTLFLRAIYGTVLVVLDDFDSFRVQLYQCHAADIPYSSAMTFFVLSMLAMGLERSFETINRTNTNIDRITVLAKLLMAVCLILSPIWPVISAVQVRNVNKVMCYCAAAVMHEKYDVWTGKSAYFCIIALTILITWWVWRVNKNRLADYNIHTRTHDLQSRFEASNNMKTTAMLLPYVVTHATFFMIVVALNYCFTRLSQEAGTQRMYVINSQIFISLIGCVDFILGPFVWMRNHEGLKTLAVKEYPFLKRFIKNRVTAATATMVHDPIGQQSIRKPPVNAAVAGMAAASIVNFRVNPDQHNVILEHLWVKKRSA